MNKVILALTLMLGILYSCSTGKHVTDQSGDNKNTVVAGRDGSSFVKAIIIKETSETTGVPAEYTWLKEHYPGYRFQQQSLVYDKNTPYDILEIITAQGEKKSVYFDISNFFGKF